MPAQGEEEAGQQEGQAQGSQRGQGLQVLVMAVEAVIEAGDKVVLAVNVEEFFLEIAGSGSQEGKLQVTVQGVFPFLDAQGPSSPAVALVGPLEVHHFLVAGLVDFVAVNEGPRKEEGQEEEGKMEEP